MKRTLAAVLATTLALSVAACSSTSNNDVSSPSSSEQSLPTTGNSAPPSGSERNQPGAKIGNTQRSWPHLLKGDVDSQHAIPGRYSADILGRPVWTPINHDGDFSASDDVEHSTSPQACSSRTPDLPGKTQIQYVNARYLVVNDKYGPTRMVEGVPEGYSRNQFGAVLATMNQIIYGTPAQGDEIGYKIDEKLWSTSQYVAKQREFKKLGEHGPNDDSRAEMYPAVSGFRVVSCSDDVVTVDVAIWFSDTLPVTVGRVPMFWRDGDWHADFSGVADKQMTQPDEKNLNGFSKVVYS